MLLVPRHFSAFVAAKFDADDCQKLYRLTDLAYAVEPGKWIEDGDSLPAEWNGRFMFSTVGDSAGEIGVTTSLLSRAYSMASTDTGHEGQGNFDFYNQPEALLDYSYLSGCSNGARVAI